MNKNSTVSEILKNSFITSFGRNILRKKVFDKTLSSYLKSSALAVPFSVIADGKKEIHADYAGNGSFYFAEDERDTFVTVSYSPMIRRMDFEIWAADLDFTSDNAPENSSDLSDWDDAAVLRPSQWKEYLTATCKRLAKNGSASALAYSCIDGNEGALAPTIIFEFFIKE